MIICARTSVRCTTSATWKRFVNIVVESQIHQTAQNTATTHAMRPGSWRCDTAELNTRMAATKTRS